MNEENNEEKNKSIEERFDAFVLATGGAKIQRKKYSDARDRLGTVIAEINADDVFLNDMRALGVDMETSSLYNEARISRIRYSQLVSSWEDEIHNIFNLVFKGIRSKNHSICKLPDYSWTLTCGKNGFGRRDEIQSKPLSFPEVQKLFKNTAVVVKALNNNNMADVSEKLIRFNNVFPAVEMREIEVKLDKSILIPCTNQNYSLQFSDVNTYTGVTLTSSMDVQFVGYNTSSDLNIREYSDYVSDLRHSNERTKGLSTRRTFRMCVSYLSDWDEFHAIALYQLKDQFNVFKKLKDAFDVRCNELSEKISSLKTEFGKEILVEVL